MQRAVVSTTSGCAGLGLLHGHSVWVADTPEAFAAGVATLIADPERRDNWPAPPTATPSAISTGRPSVRSSGNCSGRCFPPLAGNQPLFAE